MTNNNQVAFSIEEARARFHPMDDAYMRILFRDNPELVEYVLRTLTSIEDLQVQSSTTQEDMKFLGNHSLILDVYAVDSDNRVYDLEIQKASEGAKEKRARYHASVMDVKHLKPNTEFEELPRSYVIFITEKDYMGEGKPVYWVQRQNITSNKPFSDDAYILYVNGEYRGDDAIGELMHDFNCYGARDMKCAIMREKVAYLTDTEEGGPKMAGYFEELMEKRNIEMAKEMLADKALSEEAISKYCKLPLEVIKQLAKEVPVTV